MSAKNCRGDKKEKERCGYFPCPVVTTVATRTSTGITHPPTNCVIKEGIRYVENGHFEQPEEKQPDVASCQTVCKDKNLKYFSYKYVNANNNRCSCFDLYGIIPEHNGPEWTSGEAHCGEN